MMTEELTKRIKSKTRQWAQIVGTPDSEMMNSIIAMAKTYKVKTGSRSKLR